MLEFHVLSFEGPDQYARAGGIASRINGLTGSLAEDFETHLWFVGDPEAPAREQQGNLDLHRWCQWLSRHHPLGVYDGEQAKVDDYAASLPPQLLIHLSPLLRRGGRAVILAEEWHTVNAVLHLDWLLRKHQLRDNVTILWNANNTFGFAGIDWQRLRRAATITTVSRYMKHLMRQLGVDPLVIPNGLDDQAFAPTSRLAIAQMRALVGQRLLLVKMARWDPDKQWLLAMDTISELKHRGRNPLLVARGGMEAHGTDVLDRARALGLRVAERAVAAPGAVALAGSLSDSNDADVILLTSHIDPAGRRTLFRAASAVLANSRHEPFGLVGLEAMAAGGLACTGCSGEDYAVPGQNALVLERDDPMEFVHLFERVPNQVALRRAGRNTALQYAWPRVIGRVLLPRVEACARLSFTPAATPVGPSKTLQARLRPEAKRRLVA